MLNKKGYYLLYAVVAVILILISLHFYNSWHNESVNTPKILSQSDITSTNELSNKLQINKKQANDIVQYIPKSQPVATYITESLTVEKAAEKTIKDIKKQSSSLPSVATEKTDRTAVIINDDEQKVDVYKINLSPKIIRGIDYSVNMSDTNHGIVGYDVSKRISEEGKYLGIRIQYDTKDKAIFTGIRYTW